MDAGSEGSGDWIQQRVAERADQLGMTGYAVAKAAGLSEWTVRRYLQGQQSISSDKLAAIFDALGLVVKQGK